MDLHIALDEIKRSDGHVSEITAENTAGGIGDVEGRRVHLDLARLAQCWNQWRADLLTEKIKPRTNTQTQKIKPENQIPKPKK